MNLDLAIIAVYLIITLFIGFFYKKAAKNIESFALGNRSFSTNALTATISATWVSGSSFIIAINQAYQDGLLKFYSSVSSCLSALLLSYFFIPRMSEFLGDFSIAEAMGKMFGKPVRIITAFSCSILSLGFVAMQLRILGDALAYFSNIPQFVSISICSLIMVIYCARCGIIGVVITDIFQLFTFTIIVPIICALMWYKVSLGIETNSTSQIIIKIFSAKKTSNTDYMTLFFYFMLPSISAPFFQRITASKSINQAKKAFRRSALLYFLYVFLCAVTGVLLNIYNPNLPKNEIFPFMLSQLGYDGLKGVMFVAIIAMAMSTADSHLNTFAVTFTRDICMQVGFLKRQNEELEFAKYATIIMGIISAILAMYFNDLIELLLFSRNFYEPVVIPSFLLAILGFRSSGRAVLVGMIFGASTVVCWKTFQYFVPGILLIDSLIPSTSINFISYILAHVIFNEPGGWVNKSKKLN